MLPFLAMHKIAAERGEGLCPELLRLMKRSKAHSQDCLESSSSGSEGARAQPALGLVPYNIGPLREGMLPRPGSRRTSSRS